MAGIPFIKLTSSDRALAGWGLAQAAAFGAFIGLSQVWRGSGWLITGYLLPFGVYLLAVAWLLRRPERTASAVTRTIVIGMSLLYHGQLLASPQPLSNDIYRYYWDGKLLAAGVSPYAYPPQAPELAAYRDEHWLRIYNREIPTGYPPLAEGMFLLAYRLHPQPWTNRLLASLASVGAGVLLMSALRKTGKDERLALVYAWSPLVVVEFGNSGHLDAFGIFFLCAALLANLERRAHLAAVCLALGGLAKFFPLALAPLWGRRWPKTAWLALFLAFSLPWLAPVLGGTPAKGLAIFAARGDFNSSLYRLVAGMWSWALPTERAGLAARISITAILLAASLVLWQRDSEGTTLSGWRAAGRWLGLAILLSPVVHPWYVCWMVAFLPLDFSPAWLVLSGSIIFARAVYIPFEQMGTWQEPEWAAWAVYLPFYLLMGLRWVRRIGGRAPE